MANSWPYISTKNKGQFCNLKQNGLNIWRTTFMEQAPDRTLFRTVFLAITLPLTRSTFECLYSLPITTKIYKNKPSSASFCLFLVSSNKENKLYKKLTWINVHSASVAGIQTQDHLNINFLPLPLDHQGPILWRYFQCKITLCLFLSILIDCSKISTNMIVLQRQWDWNCISWGYRQG